MQFTCRSHLQFHIDFLSFYIFRLTIKITIMFALISILIESLMLLMLYEIEDVNDM